MMLLLGEFDSKTKVHHFVCYPDSEPLLQKCLRYSTTNVCADGMLFIVYYSGAQSRGGAKYSHNGWGYVHAK